MANNPIETNSFTYFLRFTWGDLEIFEPQGFDASNFVVEQEKGRLGRDTYYGNEDIDLTFGNEIGEPRETPIMLNDGTILNHYNSGLDFILQEDKENGTEANVFFVLKFDNVEFTIGQLDFGGAKTDNKTYFKCKIVQNNAQFLLKKREDVKVDLFGTEDLDGNEVTPIQTKRMLLKAKSITYKSSWNAKPDTGFISNTNSAFSAGIFIPISNSLDSFSIPISYAPFDVYSIGVDQNSFELQERSFSNRMLTAQNTLSNVKIKINNLTFVGQTTHGKARITITIAIGHQTPDYSVLDNIVLFEDNGFFGIYNQNYEVDIPIIPAGYSVTITASTFFSLGLFVNYNMYVNSFTCGSVNITATETAISTVIDVVRYEDLVKETYKRLGFPNVSAPILESGGAYYDNFCANGKMVRNLDDIKLYSSAKEVNNSFDEFCGDYQINNNEVFVGTYTEFYKNNDMGGFLTLPDIDMDIEKNDTYLINKFNFKYKKYESYRDENNTLDAIHTDSEWFVPNNNSQNEKKVECNFIRDAYMIESVRRRALQKKSTSNDTDDDIFIFDVVEIAPNTKLTINTVLNWYANYTTLTFFTNGTLRFDNLGCQVGDTVKITGAALTNVNATITHLDSGSMTVNLFTGINLFGSNFFSIEYPLTDVQYVNRTNQGLIYDDNLLNADNYSNLRYSIKRNISWWFPYLSTAGKFIPTKEIKNTYFKSNGEAQTQFTGEPDIIIENANIPIENIADQKILNQNIINTKVVADFYEVKDLIDSLQNERGFIRVADHDGRVLKGYPIKLDYTWSNNELALSLELKNESDFLTITYDGEVLTINEVGYEQEATINKTYNIFNNYIQFFDLNFIPLCNRTKVEFVEFNGVVYHTAEDLANAIESV